mmetsp:Transcript_25645/g.29476  ORF Transcript_25645/g.29476 Transcript_25645/m.29476 type:complete len:135 (-) Transcript_25645:409-813(-)
MRANFRIPLASYAKGFLYLAASIISILIFGQLGTDAQSIQSRNGLLFFITVIINMASIQGVILIFPDEKSVFLREQSQSLYSCTAYFFAKIVSEVPMLVINANILSLMLYFTTKLNTEDASHFVVFYFFTYLLI